MIRRMRSISATASKAGSTPTRTSPTCRVIRLAPPSPAARRRKQGSWSEPSSRTCDCIKGSWQSLVLYSADPRRVSLAFKGSAFERMATVLAGVALVALSSELLTNLNARGPIFVQWLLTAVAAAALTAGLIATSERRSPGRTTAPTCPPNGSRSPGSCCLACSIPSHSFWVVQVIP